MQNVVIKKLLGVDYGDARIGLATCNLDVNIVFPLKIVERSKNKAELEILRLVESEGYDVIVIGLPLSEDGSENKQCQKVRAFSERLRKRTSVKIVLQDEYGSSIEVRDMIGNSKKDIDAYSAVLILENFISSLN